MSEHHGPTILAGGEPGRNEQNVGFPYHTLTRLLKFTNEDEDFWWRATAESLGHLLSTCRYTHEDIFAYLRWYHRFIVPALSSCPRPGKKSQFAPCPVFDGSSCEHSINWKELSDNRTVRFTIEATGHQAGTAADPFNQEETKTLLTKMAQEVPGIDLKHFEIFAEEFFFSSAAAEALAPKIPPGTPLSQAWVAFDLLRGKIMAKVYFMPILKWIQTGIPTRVLVSRAVQKCSGKYGTYDAPMKLLDSYLESFVPGSGPVVEMVAIDCVDSPDSRIKVYLRTDVNTLAKAKVIYTLGGRLSGEAIDAGLEALTELWPILFRLEGSDFENTEVFPRGSYCGCAVEMKAGHAQPGTKIHIPVRKINVTDAQLCQSLSAWFAKRGHRDFAATYEENLRAAL